MSADMMSRSLNATYMNAILAISLDTTPAYVLDYVIGLIEPLATNLAFRVKSILTSKK